MEIKKSGNRGFLQEKGVVRWKEGGRGQILILRMVFERGGGKKLLSGDKIRSGRFLKKGIEL